MLIDGEVSYSDLEGAALYLVRCIEGALGVDGSATYRDASFVFDFHDPRGQMNEKMEQFSTEVDECEAEIDEIQMAWADQLASGGYEDEQYQIVVDCLRRAGYNVASAAPDELTRANSKHPDQYQACLAEAFPSLDP